MQFFEKIKENPLFWHINQFPVVAVLTTTKRKVNFYPEW